MINLATSDKEYAQRARAQSIPLMRMMEELITKDLPPCDYQYAERVRKEKSFWGGEPEPIFLYRIDTQKCDQKVILWRGIARDIATEGYDPEKTKGILLATYPGEEYRVVDGARRLATLLYLGRSAMASYPWEYSMAYRTPFGKTPKTLGP